MQDQPVKRGRGRPPGAKNRPKPPSWGNGDVAPVKGVAEPSVDPSPPAPAAAGTTRATLETDRDRLLAAIESCQRQSEPDYKTIAALQSQLNGVNRMLLRITGETAPTDANLIRSPQYLRIKTDLIAVLKKHPEALADVVRVFDTAER